MINRREEMEIDLFQLCKHVFKKLPIVLLAAVLLGAAAFGWAMLTDDTVVSYKAEALVYLTHEPWNTEEPPAPFYLSSSYTKAIAENGIHALATPYCLDAIAADAGLDYEKDKLKSMVKVSQIGTLSAIKIGVTSAVAGEAEAIVISAVRVLPDGLEKVIGEDSIKISEYSVSSETESVSGGKNPVKMGLVGAVAGAFIVAALVVLKVIFGEPVIYKAAQLASLYPEIPVLVDLGSGEKQFGYAAANLLNLASDKDEGFAVAYTAVEDAGLGALGLASAVAGFGRKVLLVDGELYGRQISAETGLADGAGLKELVSGDAELAAVARKYENLDVIAGGKDVENIAAILADKKMAQLIENIKSVYDYVIINLPALGLEADALPMIKLADGVVLGLEENKTTIKESDGCVEQLMRTGTKILGFVVG